MYQKIISLLASRKFFYFIVVLFFLQAGWIAISSLYPMAFDEEFHFGLIQLYSHHWSPFLAAQPPSSSMYGALFRDPSYLYHYLMSFPYRFLGMFIHSQEIMVIALRFMNIAFFGAGLVLWRKLLLKAGGSRPLVHSVLLVFVLIPVLPLLAGQINYDNLFIVFVAYAMLLSLDIKEKLSRQQGLDMLALGKLLVVCLLGSLVKYAFLPLFAAIFAVLAFVVYKRLYRRGRLVRDLSWGVARLSQTARWLLVGLLLVSFILFVQRYGVNAVRYHAIMPSCDQVLTVSECSSYGPWNRDYNLAKNHWQVSHNPFTYLDDWLQGMNRRLYFTLAGPTVGYQTEKPLPLPITAGSIYITAGVIAAILYGRRIMHGRQGRILVFLLGIALAYIVAVFFVDYKAYLRTGVPVAINGRYLIPVLPILMLLAGRGYTELLRKVPKAKLALGSVFIICFLAGGGVLTFILRNNDTWLWNHSAVRRMNSTTRQTLLHIIPSGSPPDVLWR